MERTVEPEWLDQDLGTQAEIDASLRTISRVNRLFGGNRLHAQLLRRALAASTNAIETGFCPHILEVACGHAEVLQAALLRLRRPVRLTLLDRSQHHLPELAQWPAALPTPQLLVGDALALPLPDASVDIVSCCLFAHHLAPDQIAQFVAESLRVARVAVLINDLERTRMHAWLAEFFCRLNPSRLSRHDGPASVRAAYTAQEMCRMLASTGHRFTLQRYFLFRLGGIVWKR
jgi:ubiquinone/menaquinone biosynthesis C-methylase UbiE